MLQHKLTHNSLRTYNLVGKCLDAHRTMVNQEDLMGWENPVEWVPAKWTSTILGL